MREQEKKKVPLGVRVLGGLNCLLGLTSLIRYFRVTPEDFQESLKLFENNNLSANVTFEQFRAFNTIPLIISFFFLLAGVGIILKKEWARKITLYISFGLVILVFFSILAQPAMIGLVILPVVYLGILIMYFTNKKVESFFVPERKVKQ